MKINPGLKEILIKHMKKDPTLSISHANRGAVNPEAKIQSAIRFARSDTPLRINGDARKLEAIRKEMEEQTTETIQIEKGRGFYSGESHLEIPIYTEKEWDEQNMGPADKLLKVNEQLKEQGRFLQSHISLKSDEEKKQILIEEMPFEFYTEDTVTKKVFGPGSRPEEIVQYLKEENCVSRLSPQLADQIIEELNQHEYISDVELDYVVDDEHNLSDNVIAGLKLQDYQVDEEPYSYSTSVDTLREKDGELSAVVYDDRDYPIDKLIYEPNEDKWRGKKYDMQLTNTIRELKNVYAKNSSNTAEYYVAKGNEISR